MVFIAFRFFFPPFELPRSHPLDLPPPRRFFFPIPAGGKARAFGRSPPSSYRSGQISLFCCFLINPFPPSLGHLLCFLVQLPRPLFSVDSSHSFRLSRHPGGRGFLQMKCCPSRDQTMGLGPRTFFSGVPFFLPTPQRYYFRCFFLFSPPECFTLECFLCLPVAPAVLERDLHLASHRSFSCPVWCFGFWGGFCVGA